MTICIGIDLGGTKIAGAAVDLDNGKVLSQQVIPTAAHLGTAAVLGRVVSVVNDVLHKSNLSCEDVAGLGIGVPGAIDPERGYTKFLPNLPSGWRDIPIVSEVGRMSGLSTWLINDARAFTLAEAHLGAGRDAQTVIGITLGTGIGGGIVVKGHLHEGIAMSAGEIGHMTLDPNGPPCSCGSYGCFETFASGTAIAAYGEYAVIRGFTTIIGDLAERDLNKITPEIIMRAAGQGDAVAKEILHRAGRYLGIGLASLITLLSPEKIVIGGGAANLGDWILEPAREEIKRRCFVTPLEGIEVVRATLGGDAGVIGAAVWAGHKAQG